MYIRKRNKKYFNISLILSNLINFIESTTNFIVANTPTFVSLSSREEVVSKNFFDHIYKENVTEKIFRYFCSANNSNLNN